MSTVNSKDIKIILCLNNIKINFSKISYNIWYDWGNDGRQATKVDGLSDANIIGRLLKRRLQLLMVVLLQNDRSSRNFFRCRQYWTIGTKFWKCCRFKSEHWRWMDVVLFAVVTVDDVQEWFDVGVVPIGITTFAAGGRWRRFVSRAQCKTNIFCGHNWGRDRRRSG